MTATVLQSGHNETNSSVSTLTLSPTGLTPGSTIEVLVGCNHFFGISSVVGSVNGAYTATGTPADDSTNKKLATYRFEGNGASSETITITFDSAHANLGAIWVEIGGVKTLDVAAAGRVQSSPGTSTDAVATTAATNTVQPALIVAASWDEAGNAPSAGTGYTNVALVDWGATGPGGQVRVESKRITTTGSQSATWTATVGTNTHLNVAAIYPEAPITPPAGSLTPSGATPQRGGRQRHDFDTAHGIKDSTAPCQQPTP